MTFSFEGVWRSSYSYWLSTLQVGFTLDPTEQLFHPLKTRKQAISENGRITGLAVQREGRYQANASVCGPSIFRKLRICNQILNNAIFILAFDLS